MAPKVRDITGERFGLWTVLGRADDITEEGVSRWRVKCACGTVKEIWKSSLTAGRSKGCGCHRKTAGARPKRYRTRTYVCWERMKSRCLDKKDSRYSYYGGRGITVCEHWMIFKNFLEDMGEAPDGRSLERIDVNGNYEPGNCEWADLDTQANNQRGQKKYLVDGEWRTQTQLLRYWNVRKTEAKKRLHAYPMKVNGEE